MAVMNSPYLRVTSVGSQKELVYFSSSTQALRSSALSSVIDSRFLFLRLDSSALWLFIGYYQISSVSFSSHVLQWSFRRDHFKLLVVGQLTATYYKGVNCKVPLHLLHMRKIFLLLLSVGWIVVVTSFGIFSSSSRLLQLLMSNPKPLSLYIFNV